MYNNYVLSQNTVEVLIKQFFYFFPSSIDVSNVCLHDLIVKSIQRNLDSSSLLESAGLDLLLFSQTGCFGHY